LAHYSVPAAVALAFHCSARIAVAARDSINRSACRSVAVFDEHDNLLF
jgi:hypothetical protein